jgi:penicillin amidase
MLRTWNGDMTVERPEPLILDVFLGELERLAWDEPEFDPMYIAPTGDTLSSPVHVPRPHQSLLVTLLRDAPMLKWIDIIRTGGREDAAGLLRAALQSAVERMDREFGWGQGSWRWGNHRQIHLKHLIDSPALQALGRGPVEFPGYRETLSPAGGRVTTHSASWRVVVDFSSGRPQGQGIYPGGQSGNPFSRRYDLHLPAYVSFDYYDLLKPSSRGELDEARILGKTTLQPVGQVN